MTAPPELLEIIRELRHPSVVQTGATKKDDQWALLAIIRKGTVVPIKEVEDSVGEFPVVYQEEPESPPIARPAFPSKGE